MKSFLKDTLKVRIHPTRETMGLDAANHIVDCLSGLLAQQELVNMIFAAAPSQHEVLAELCNSKGLDWHRVNAFHMDEYVGLSNDAPQRFGQFLDQAIFKQLPFRTVNYIQADAVNAQVECNRYADLLHQYPADLVCMGIGENTHIAFNDPHVADFNDPFLVKLVELDEVSRMQQVNDGCFETLDRVPRQAITLTIPALMQAAHVFCVVPGPTKAEAIRHTLQEEIKPMYPSTILRRHPDATLFMDLAAAQQLNDVHD